MAASLIERLKNKFADLYAREPARVNAALTTGLVGLLVLAGLAISPAAAGMIGLVVAFVAPELVAELTRPRVASPATVAELLTEAPLSAEFEEGLAELEARVLKEQEGAE